MSNFPAQSQVKSKKCHHAPRLFFFFYTCITFHHESFVHLFAGGGACPRPPRIRFCFDVTYHLQTPLSSVGLNRLLLSMTIACQKHDLKLRKLQRDCCMPSQFFEINRKGTKKILRVVFHSYPAHMSKFGGWCQNVAHSYLGLDSLCCRVLCSCLESKCSQAPH